jgi:hypothetical protein
LRDASGDFGIAGLLELELIEGGDTVEHCAAEVAVDAWGVREEQYGIGAVPKFDSLVAGGQEAVAPESFEESLVGISAAPVRDQDKEGWEVGGEAAESVAGPGTEGGSAWLL